MADFAPYDPSLFEDEEDTTEEQPQYQAYDPSLFEDDSADTEDIDPNFPPREEKGFMDYFTSPNASKEARKNQLFSEKSRERTRELAAQQRVDNGFEQVVTPEMDDRELGEQLSDSGKALMGGFGGLLEIGGWATETIGDKVGSDAIISLGQRLRDEGQDAKQWWDSGLSEGYKNVMKQKALSIDKYGDVDITQTAKNLAKNPEMIWQSIVESTPATLAGMGTGGLLAKAFKFVPKIGTVVADSMGFGLGEGTISAASGGLQTEKEVMNPLKTPQSVLEKSPEYQAALLVTEGDKDAARQLVARAAAGEAAALNLLSTTIFSAPMGAVFGKFLRGERLANTWWKALTVSTLGEAGQEGVQNPLEQIGQNAAVKLYADPSKDITEGAGEATLQGVITGGAMGHGMAVASEAYQATPRAKRKAGEQEMADTIDSYDIVPTTAQEDMKRARLGGQSLGAVQSPLARTMMYVNSLPPEEKEKWKEDFKKSMDDATPEEKEQFVGDVVNELESMPPEEAVDTLDDLGEFLDNEDVNEIVEGYNKQKTEQEAEQQPEEEFTEDNYNRGYDEEQEIVYAEEEKSPGSAYSEKQGQPIKSMDEWERERKNVDNLKETLPKLKTEKARKNLEEAIKRREERLDAYHKPDAPAFYSHLEKVLDESKMRKMTAKQLTGYLKKNNVKDEELRWTGIGEYLSSLDDNAKVSLDEVKSRVNLPNLKEVKYTEQYVYLPERPADFAFVKYSKVDGKGAKEYTYNRSWRGGKPIKIDVTDVGGKLHLVIDTGSYRMDGGTFDNWDRVIKEIRNFADDGYFNKGSAGQPRHGQYTTPNTEGKNYREIVTKLDTSRQYKEEEFRDWYNNKERKPRGLSYDEIIAQEKKENARSRERKMWENHLEENDFKDWWNNTRVEGDKTYKQLMAQEYVQGVPSFARRAWEEQKEKQKFVAKNHFEEPEARGYVYHRRAKDVVTEDGEFTLLSEESQSDRHQQGRERGYALSGKALQDEQLRLTKEMIAKDNAYKKIVKDLNDKTEEMANKLGVSETMVVSFEGFVVNPEEAKRDKENILEKIKKNKEYKNAFKRTRDIINEYGEDIKEMPQNIRDEYVKLSDVMASTISYSGSNKLARYEKELETHELVEKHKDELIELAKMREDRRRLRKEARKPRREIENLSDRVPDAPYRNTNDWLLKIIKDEINEAVKSGHQRVAWAGGEEHARRYNLRSMVDQIVVDKLENGKRNVNIFTNREWNPIGMTVDSNGIVQEGEYADKHLGSVVGKEMAEKILSTEKDHVVIQEEGLEVGGEGMKEFYDKRRVNVANKYIKQFGSKVEVTKLKNGQEVWSFKVTPEMVKSVKEKGQPLFIEGGRKPKRSMTKEEKIAVARVKREAGNPKIVKHDTVLTNDKGKAVGGYYNPNTHEVHLSKGYHNDYRTVMHELIHAKYHKILMTNEEFAKGLDEVIETFESKTSNPEAYGLKKGQKGRRVEFLSEFFSNPEFRSELDNTAYDQDMTLLDRILELLKAFIGKGKRGQKTASEAILEHLENMKDEVAKSHGKEMTGKAEKVNAPEAAEKTRKGTAFIPYETMISDKLGGDKRRLYDVLNSTGKGVPAFRKELEEELTKVLVTDKGFNRIFASMGMRVKDVGGLVGSFEGKHNALRFMEVPVEYTMSGQLTQESKDKLDFVSAVLGKLLHQDSVGYFGLQDAESPEEATAFRYVMRKKFDKKMADEIYAATGLDPVAHPSGYGFYLVDFDKNTENLLEKARSLTNKFNVKEVRFFKHDGDYHTQSDYDEVIEKGLKNGEIHKGQRSRRDEGIRRDYDGLHEKTEEVFRRYAAKTGLDWEAEVPDPGRAIGGNQASNLYKGEESLTWADPNITTNRQLAEALDARSFRSDHGIIGKDFSPRAVKLIGDMLADEIETAIKADPENSGIGWYSTNFNEAIEVLSREFPELKEPVQRNIFTAIVAVTSDGQEVSKNLEMAIDIYRHYKKTREITTTGAGGSSMKNINGNLKLLGELIEQHGANLESWLKQERLISDIAKELVKRERNGKPFKSQTEENDAINKMAGKLGYPQGFRGVNSYIFGAKLGAFYQNLSGGHGFLTMDRWWMRSINRLRGNLTSTPSVSSINEYKDLLVKEKVMSRKKADSLTASELQKIVKHYQKLYEKSEYKDKTPLNVKSNTLAKSMSATKDSPMGGEDRVFMINAANHALDILKKKGYDLTLADAQAVEWYFEKTLFKNMGIPPKKENIGYGEAIKELIEKQKKEGIVFSEPIEEQKSAQLEYNNIQMREGFVRITDILSAPSRGITFTLNRIDKLVYDKLTNKIEDTKFERFIRRYMGADMAGLGMLSLEQSNKFKRIYQKMLGDKSKGEMKAEGAAEIVDNGYFDITPDEFERITGYDANEMLDALGESTNAAYQFTAEMRKKLYHIVVTQYLENPEAREELRQLAPELAEDLDDIRNYIDMLSEQAMERGLLLPSQFHKWNDKYLSRLYAIGNPQLQEATVEAIAGIKQGKIESGRKIESIVDYIAEFPDEAQRLGAVLDPTLAIKKTISMTQANIALDDFFRSIAYDTDILNPNHTVELPYMIGNLPMVFSPHYGEKRIVPWIEDKIRDLEWASEDETLNASEVNDILSEIVELEQVKEDINSQIKGAEGAIKLSNDNDLATVEENIRYSVLSGLPISKDLAALVNAQRRLTMKPEMFSDKLDNLGSRYLAYFKWAKVPANAFSYPRNLASNEFQWTMSGADPVTFPAEWIRALKSYLMKDEWYDKARGEGVIGENQMTYELNNALELLIRQAEANKSKMREIVLKGMEMVGEWYGAIDDISKIARMRYGVETDGLDLFEAAVIAQDTHYDYGLTYDIVRKVRDPNINVGVMGKLLYNLFPTYQHKTIAFLYETLKKRAATFGIMSAVIALALGYDTDEDRAREEMGEAEWNRLQKSIPEWMKYNPFIRTKYVRGDDGTWQIVFTDFGNIIPFGSLATAMNMLAHGEWTDAMGQMGMGGSAFQIVGDIVNNKDSFSNKTIHYEFDDYQKAVDITRYVASQLAPGTINKIINLSETRHPVKPRIFGVNTYVYDPEDLINWKEYDAKDAKTEAARRASKYKGIIRRAKKELDKGKLSVDEFMEIRDENMERIEYWYGLGRKASRERTNKTDYEVDFKDDAKFGKDKAKYLKDLKSFAGRSKTDAELFRKTVKREDLKTLEQMEQVRKETEKKVGDLKKAIKELERMKLTAQKRSEAIGKAKDQIEKAYITGSKAMKILRKRYKGKQ